MSHQATLGSLAPGSRGRIVAIEEAGGGNEVHLRLHEMGFDEGVEVEVLHRGPIGGDPIAVRVGSMTVAMRRKDADLVRVATGEAGMREAAE